MSRLGNLCKPFGWILLPVLLVAPVVAHNVEVAGDVAATFHIEPNDRPKAGRLSQAWFALTRKGGQLIPLSQCDCKLAIYSVPYKEGSQPLMQPSLKAINTENYKGIPGAVIIFPKVGQYELELSGKPKAPANFKPFELSYKVTVGSK